MGSTSQPRVASGKDSINNNSDCNSEHALALCKNFIFYLLHLNHIVTLFITISIFIDEETGTERLK